MEKLKLLKKHFLIIIIVTLLGELYFYPLNANFRFSAGVVAFNMVLLLADDFNEIRLAFFTGISVVTLRFLIADVSTVNSDLEIFYANLPSAAYYIMFGFLAHAVSLRKNRDNSLRTILSLFSIDVLSNIIEAMIKHNLTTPLFKFILLIGFIRSIVSFGIYMIVETQNNIIRKKEHQKRYIQLNTLVSNIQAELFYLKKSSQDIENVMNMSYLLYESNKDNENVSQDALNIAREVHEIKKDYYRVLNGFESFLKEFETNESMSLKDIAFIIEGNTKRYIEERMKDIEINIEVHNNLNIKKYYSIFTILNNLITNSVDAIKKSGYIKIAQNADDESIVFTITDNGGGIDENLIPYIFNPGFTTKFDKNTGISSTGIGLSHVKNIVDDLNGQIKVNVINEETEFEITIPLKSLVIQKI